MSGTDAHPGEEMAPQADEAALLIGCLRGLPVTIPEDFDWRVLLRLATTHGVLLVVGEPLLKECQELPEFFSTAVREAREAAEELADELEKLLGAFWEQGIEVIPLKGPAMSQTLYGSVAMRSCDDLDLLVRRIDFHRAGRLLQQRGFMARGDADDYHRKFARGGLLVELHFELASPRSFPFAMNDVWTRAERRNFRGKPVRALPAEDLVLFLCLHGLKHGFGRLIWILDVALALKSLPKCRTGQLPDQLMERARSQGMEQVLLIGCEMARETLLEEPAWMQAAWSQIPGAVEKARKAVQRLLVSPPTSRDDAQIWILYLQTESGILQRWRRRWSFLVPTLEDARWAERHGITPLFLPVLRPFRLLKKHGAPKVWHMLFPPRL